MKIIYAINGDEIKVSDCDWLFLVGYSWSNNNRGYPLCNIRDTWNGYKTHKKTLHWFVIQLMGIKIPEGMTVDHIDRDRSNNQRENLRAASRSLQVINTKDRVSKHGIPGIYFITNRQKPWVARIMYKNRKIHLGCFPTKELAGEAYQQAKLIRDKKEIEKCKRLSESDIKKV